MLKSALEILQEMGKVSEAMLSRVFSEKEPLCSNEVCHELIKQELLSQDDYFYALALSFEMPIYQEIDILQISKERIKQIPYSFSRKHLALPIEEQPECLIVALADPLNLEVLADLRFLLQKPLQAVYCHKETLLKAINFCYNQEEGAASQLLADLTDQKRTDVYSEFVVDDLLDTKDQAPIIKLLNLILTEAIQQGASDIHFEPFEDDLKIRYRIDGVLQKRHSPPREYQAPLITRIKVMARLDIAEQRLPQDGRIKLKMGSREIDFRVSTIPVTNGERIVLRILDKGNITLGLEQLSLPSALLHDFKQLIKIPEGIILVTGPTGSGKTTTLYSAICDIASHELNIMTIEDPVEYKLPGIAQINVQTKIQLDFATGLRHILRQDPDVILIGEIRDKETAEIAIQASLTGHLVLSTLHTNDAPSAITRLVDMGIEPYLLSSSIVGVLAQRLVRAICPACKKAYAGNSLELEALHYPGTQDLTLYKGEGCSACYESGYKGRKGIYELMKMSSAIKNQILKSADATEIRHIALQEGMSSLKYYGKELVLNGVTTLSEILRVTTLI